MGRPEEPRDEPRGGRTSRLLLVLGVPVVGLHIVAAFVAVEMIVDAPAGSGAGGGIPVPWALATFGTAVLASALVIAAFFHVRNRQRPGVDPDDADPDDEIDAGDPPRAEDVSGPVGDAVISTLRSMHTERRAARKVLVGFIEAIPDAVIVAERDDGGSLRIRHVNRAAADLAGVAADQLVGEMVETILPGTSGPKGMLHRLDERGRASARDSRFVRRGGGAREVRLSASRIDAPTAPGEAPASYVLVASDLGDTRRQERRRVATYRLSELVQDAETPMELLRGVESVMRGVVLVDAFHVAAVELGSGRLSIAYCSDARSPGLSVHEVTKGLSGYALAREAAVILNAEQIRHLVGLGEVKAAEPVAESWASAPVRAGPGVRGVIVIQNHDPSQPFQSADVDLLAFAAEQCAAWFRRRRIDDERKRLSAAVEQAVDAVMILDDQCRVAYVNPAFERQSGFTREETMGRSLDDLWRPDERGVPVAAIWEFVRGGRPWSGSTSCIRKEGDPFPVEATLSAMLAEDDSITEHVVVQHDVSHEVALEEQLRQAQKMEAVGILAGGVAHDFNNLLSVIQGYGELAQSTVTDPDTSAWLDQVLSASRRASILIGQLLAFSRRQVIEPRPLDLSAVVLDVEKMIERLIGEDIQLTVETSVDSDLVEADPHRIEQVLMNLAVNARDAMPRGGTLTLRTDVEEIDAAQAQWMPDLEAGTHVVLSVADTGVGMSAATIKRIFEPFYTTKPKGHGTGLGLSTVYGIVKQAGGYVGVTSEEGRGTEFRIYLPSIGRSAAPAHEQEAADAPTTGTETVFVVEDESALRGFVERVLVRQGYQVLTAGNGDQALEIARAHDGPVDLLLADVVMPGMNGSSLAATMLEERPKMAVLFMSGYPDASIANYGVLDPDVDLLQKPFTSAQLLKRVRRALDAKSRALKGTRKRLASRL